MPSPPKNRDTTHRRRAGTGCRQERPSAPPEGPQRHRSPSAPRCGVLAICAPSSGDLHHRQARSALVSVLTVQAGEASPARQPTQVADMSQPRGDHHAARDPECGDFTATTQHRIRESSGVRTEVASSPRLVDLTHPCGSTNRDAGNSDRVQRQKQSAAAPGTKRRSAVRRCEEARSWQAYRRRIGLVGIRPGDWALSPAGDLCPTRLFDTGVGYDGCSSHRVRPCRESVITAERREPIWAPGLRAPTALSSSL